MIGLFGCFIIVTKRKDNMTISVIIGSTRQGRFSEKPAKRHDRRSPLVDGSPEDGARALTDGR
jgi:hypothetical protein